MFLRAEIIKNDDKIFKYSKFLQNQKKKDFRFLSLMSEGVRILTSFGYGCNLCFYSGMAK